MNKQTVQNTLCIFVYEQGNRTEYMMYFCSAIQNLVVTICTTSLNPLNAELNLNCHLLALRVLGAHHILHISRIGVNIKSSAVCPHGALTL